MKYVTATKQKGNPDIVRGVEFVHAVCKPPTGQLFFTLKFSAN